MSTRLPLFDARNEDHELETDPVARQARPGPVLIGAALLATIIAAGTAAAQSWTPLASGTTVRLNSIETGSFSDCWVVGDHGFVASSNGCETFTAEDVGADDLDLTSQTRGSSIDIWIGGEEGVVRRFTGSSWVGLDVPGASVSGEVFRLFSGTSNAAWAVGDQGSIYRNLSGTAGGWELSDSTGGALYGGHGSVTSVAWVVGAGGLILETVDGGSTWNPIPSGTTADLYALVPGSTGTLLIVGDQGTILKSSDFGATWTPRVSHTSVALRGLSISNQNSEWMIAVGDYGTVLRSTDGGESWCHLHATTADLRGVEMISNATAVAVGDNGTIVRTDDSGGACQAEPLLLFADRFESGDTSKWSSSSR